MQSHCSYNPPASVYAESATGEPRYLFPKRELAQRPLSETPGFLFVEEGRILTVTPDDWGAGPVFAWVEVEWSDGTRESIGVDGAAWDAALLGEEAPL